ncbi:type II secretion system protein N [Rhodoferax ferrireducens]|uniref:type II secretion system protein N n=1 Tax=Rhodoferax ferrireducens TaxID=192843 RepID=UPI001E3CC222|nr:type II secretion system protein N [Rhodoferax ferrireducens]
MQMHAHHPSYSLWWLRTATFTLAALAAASAAFWVLKWTATVPAPTSAALLTSIAAPADPQAVARLLGGGQASVVAAPGARPDTSASRFKLTGVVADRRTGGYAVIAIDGKPAQPYRVGARVDDALVLHSVAPRSAALAASVDAPVSLTLELPPLVQP